jgi:hypothetical protein
MDLSIKRNDAFRVLSDATKISISDLEKIIIQGLIDEELIGGELEDCGRSIAEVCNEQGFSVPQIVELLFPGQINQEIPELLDSIFIWGDAVDHPCDQCGCEMEGEEDGHGKHTWTDWECSNPNCDNKISNEPDWDSMPGGHDYY